MILSRPSRGLQKRGATSLATFEAVLISAVLLCGGALQAQQPAADESRAERFRRMSKEAEAKGLADPFKGVTTKGDVIPGLFRVASTGVSTAPVREAATAFLNSLSAEQRAKTTFPVDDPEWRKWMNQHFYVRQGTSFKEMSEPQREAA